LSQFFQDSWPRPAFPAFFSTTAVPTSGESHPVGGRKRDTHAGGRSQESGKAGKRETSYPGGFFFFFFSFLSALLGGWSMRGHIILVLDAEYPEIPVFIPGPRLKTRKQKQRERRKRNSGNSNGDQQHDRLRNLPSHEAGDGPSRRQERAAVPGLLAWVFLLSCLDLLVYLFSCTFVFFYIIFLYTRFLVYPFTLSCVFGHLPDACRLLGIVSQSHLISESKTL
jgi:hypothetical protein